jgi:hypothetical protein
MELLMNNDGTLDELTLVVVTAFLFLIKEFNELKVVKAMLLKL